MAGGQGETHSGAENVRSELLFAGVFTRDAQGLRVVRVEPEP